MNPKELMKDTKSLRPHLAPPSTNFNSNKNKISTEYEHQAFLIKKQDEDLEGLGESVQRLGNMGKSINEELVDQERLIIDVEHDIDATTTRLDFVHKLLDLSQGRHRYSQFRTSPLAIQGLSRRSTHTIELFREQEGRPGKSYRDRSVAMPTFDSVPIIDVEPLVRMKWDEGMAEDPEVRDVVRQLDLACRHMGFFYVSGHGVPPELCQAVLDVGHEFFTLPESQKLRIGMSSASGFRGYQKLGENITKGVPDQHEAIDYFKEFEPTKPLSRSDNPLIGRNQWPDYVSKFRPLVQEYLDVMIELGRTIMQGIALALGGPRDLFEGEKAGDPFWIFRVIGYPPVTNLGHSSDANGDVGCGAHTDYGLLTLVNQDQNITALQVKTKDEKWIWVDPIPGTFVVNIGDMLTIWTNGVYQSTLHRVINNNSKYRVSVPFFYEPNFDTLVEPLSFMQNSAIAEGTKYAPVVYGDHVINKVLHNFG